MKSDQVAGKNFSFGLHLFGSFGGRLWSGQRHFPGKLRHPRTPQYLCTIGHRGAGFPRPLATHLFPDCICLVLFSDIFGSARAII
jgi:hypothetical protein